jgi:hypothetical protein
MASALEINHLQLPVVLRPAERRISNTHLYVSGRIVMMRFLELYLNPLGISSIVLYGKKNLSQPLTPDANIFLDCRTISQDFQNVTSIHVRGLHSNLHNRLGAFHTKSVYNLCFHDLTYHPVQVRMILIAIGFGLLRWIKTIVPLPPEK